MFLEAKQMTLDWWIDWLNLVYLQKCRFLEKKKHHSVKPKLPGGGYDPYNHTEKQTFQQVSRRMKVSTHQWLQIPTQVVCIGNTPPTAKRCTMCNHVVQHAIRAENCWSLLFLIVSWSEEYKQITQSFFSTFVQVRTYLHLKGTSTFL